MSLEPDAEQAARALEEARRRRNQAIDAQCQPRWFSAVWGIYVFLFLATPDLVPLLHLEPWKTWWYGAIAVLALLLLAGASTRVGRSLLGLPPRLRHKGLIPPERLSRHRSPWIGLLFVVGVMGVFSGGSIAILSYVPHWHLLLGLLAGVAVVRPSHLERLKRLNQGGARS